MAQVGVCGGGCRCSSSHTTGRGCFLQESADSSFSLLARDPGLMTPSAVCSSQPGTRPIVPLAQAPHPPSSRPFCGLTWKTLAAETRQARAEERVAPKMPAVIRGAKPDTMLMVCGDLGLRDSMVGGLSQEPPSVATHSLLRAGAGS